MDVASGVGAWWGEACENIERGWDQRVFQGRVRFGLLGLRSSSRLFLFLSLSLINHLMIAFRSSFVSPRGFQPVLLPGSSLGPTTSDDR